MVEYKIHMLTVRYIYTANVHSHSAVSLELMIQENMDKFCILSWSNLSIENVIRFCRICGKFSNNFEKIQT